MAEALKHFFYERLVRAIASELVSALRRKGPRSRRERRRGD
jgi:hypothetical protein